jgi:hypothetical protein
MPILVGCSDDAPEGGSEFTPVQDWVTEPHYEFGDAMEGDAVFGSVTDVNVHACVFRRSRPPIPTSRSGFPKHADHLGGAEVHSGAGGVGLRVEV